MQYYKLTTTKWLTRKPRYSYLKHQTDHKDHTHTRNYISMICNHKFVAQYRGIFARFSPAWHFPGVKSETPQKKRKRSSGVQALAAKKLVPNLWLGQSIPGVTVIWVSPCFGYPRTQITSDLGIPSRDTQNTESVNTAHWGKWNHP